LTGSSPPPPRPLRLATLAVRDLRNLLDVALEPGPRFNVVSGDNGQGKTNLLEAIYLLATTKSFRTSRLAEVVALGRGTGVVRGRIDEAGHVREQSVGLEGGARTVRMDGKRPPSLAAYAVRTPVVVFHPAEVSLSMGSGAERRRLLDRVTLYLEPGSLSDLDAYTRALRSRQKTLDTRGPSAPELDAWEELMVKHGLAVSAARARTSVRFSAVAVEAFARIGSPGLVLTATYGASAPADAEAFARRLVEGRERDRARGSASVGPHRDDLALALAGVGVRGVASQGQHRAVVLALKSAEVAVISGARGVQALLLLDDVSSELDRSRTAALFSFLRAHEGQVFLSTTRPELIDTGVSAGPRERLDWTIESGRLRPL
jgi:DNA replication and repair protein RecF